MKIHSMGSHDCIESPSWGYVKGIPSDTSPGLETGTSSEERDTRADS